MKNIFEIKNVNFSVDDTLINSVRAELETKIKQKRSFRIL